MIAAVELDGKALADADVVLRADRAVVLPAAVTHPQPPPQLGFPKTFLRDCLWLQLQSWHALEFATGALRGERELVLQVVALDGRALAHAAAELQADGELG